MATTDRRISELTIPGAVEDTDVIPGYRTETEEDPAIDLQIPLGLIREAAVASVFAASLTGQATFDASSLLTLTGQTTTVTVTGAALGDFVTAVSLGIDLQGITVTAWVSAANTVSVRFQNDTGGTIDLASATIRVVVTPKAVFGF